MTEATFTICPDCREEIDPDDPQVVYAKQQVDVTGMGQARTFTDGLGGFFHAWCNPDRVGYARRARPA